jgi:predicted DNA-binding ribbon-helix-helix protein
LIPSPRRTIFIPMDGLKKRSLSLSGHRTSVALEPEFWQALDAVARQRGLSLQNLIVELDSRRGERPLASACRVAALNFALGLTLSRDAPRISA